MAVKSTTNLQLGLKDVVDGLSSIHIWPMLGWQEVRQRYRRSVLGPFWLTLSTALMIGAMGPLYGRLFKQDISGYFAYLAVSFVLWQMISQMISDSCVAFVAAEGFIKQIKLPLTIHVLRVIWKNLIIFAHNAVVILIVIAYYRPPLNGSLLLFPIAILVFALNALFFGTILGLVSARFRDIPLVVTNVVQAAFFLTPIMWHPQMLGRHAWTVNLNPFYHFIEVMRAPLIGQPPNPSSWLAVGVITLLGCVAMVLIFSRFRARIAYWV